MKVNDAISLLSYGTRWQLIGARTGKKLCNSSSTEKHRNKFMNLETTDNPIFPSFYCRENIITKTTEFMIPMINIWVSGE